MVNIEALGRAFVEVTTCSKEVADQQIQFALHPPLKFRHFLSPHPVPRVNVLSPMKVAFKIALGKTHPCKELSFFYVTQEKHSIIQCAVANLAPKETMIQ